MEELKIDGTIRSITATERRKKGSISTEGKIVIRDAEGTYTITITGPETLVQGYTPEDTITIIMRREQQTLEESTTTQGNE